MAILQKMGCPPGPDRPMCWGPDQYWAVFGVPVNEYPKMIFIAFIISGGVFLILDRINRKYNNFQLKKNLLISGIVFLAVMVLEIFMLLKYYSNIVY